MAMAHQIPNIKLNNGRQMPIIGLGTYARKADIGQYKQAVLWGLEAGYRHIDTAAAYENEVEVGTAIAEKIKEGAVTRDELFVTTKLHNDRHSEDEVVPSLKESLQRLKLDYVDLYLVHWPLSVNEKGEDTAIDYLQTWKGMEAALELGLTRSIGVSNFNKDQMERLIKNARVKPVVNQFEINPTLTQHELVSWSQDNFVVPVAYTPLGLLSEARPEFAGLDVIKTDPKLGEIAEKYGKSRAQIALRYLTQRGVAIIPKSFTKSRIGDNSHIFNFLLTDDEMAVLDGFNLNHRCVPASTLKNFTNYPF